MPARNVLRRGRRVKSNIHVDAELLAAWSEGSLPKDQAAQVETHLADCSSCQEMLAVFARTEPAPVVPVPRVSGFSLTRWQWRWAIPIAAAATVVAIWVAIPEDERTAQLNPTAAPSLSERAGPAPTPASDAAAAQARERKPEQKPVTPRRDALSTLENRAEKEAPAAKVEQFEKPAAKEQDQDLKAEARQAPASAAAPTARQAAGLLRQAPAEVVSPDPLVRWRIVPTDRLERSTNGGKTWDPVTLPPSITPTGVTAPSANTAVVVASDGRQFRTDDQGKTWNLVQP